MWRKTILKQSRFSWTGVLFTVLTVQLGRLSIRMSMFSHCHVDSVLFSAAGFIYKKKQAVTQHSFPVFLLFPWKQKTLPQNDSFFNENTKPIHFHLKDCVKREVEEYRPDGVGLTSTPSLDSGTQPLERSWILHVSGVERWWAAGGFLTGPKLSCQVLEFIPVNERVVTLHLRVGGRVPVILAYRSETVPLDW